MGFEATRVAEVYAPTRGTAADFGSGYLVAGDLVLTARHVVERASGQCQVRLVGHELWSDATPVWRGAGDCDAALLRVTERDPGQAVRLGRLATGARAESRALGFPLAQARARLRDTEEIVGEVAPLSGYKRGSLTVHIKGSIPDRDGSGHSPWEGYSGAALFCGQLLVGVVTVDPSNFGTSRLEAVPVTAMAEDAHFRAELGVPAPGLLPALEDEPARACLSPPYAPLPARATPEFLRRSPIHLLYPHYGVVPFHGREGELANLGRWLDGGSFSVGLLVGRGGSGKTRLAAELCHVHADGRWVAGFVAPGADIQTIASSVSPLLLVIDEAQTRAEELAALISHLARNARAEATRLLLVSREGGDWWQESLPRGLDVESRSLIDLPWEHEIGALEDGVSVRSEVFATAVRSFAERTQRSSVMVSPPDLTSTLFDRVLFVHLAALTALEAERLPVGLAVGGSLVEDRVNHEADYWQSSARQAGLHALDRHVLERAVAVATLATAESEGEAAALLAAVPDLTGEAEGLRRQVARWLRSLYPGDGYFRPLEPDLLGEHLVGSVLGEVPELATNLLGGLAHEPTRPLTILTRAARTYETAEVALREVLVRHLDSLWRPAMDVAEEAGEPVGRLLAEVLAASSRTDLGHEILQILPQETVALREVALVATEQVLRDVRARPAGLDRDETLADLLIKLSHRLGDLGRHDEALAAIQEAVTVARKLAAADPGTFRTDLSRSLTDLSAHLFDLGRYRDALAASEAAVATDRDLAAADPDTFLFALSVSLNNFSNALAMVGRDEDALAAIEETVAVQRDFAGSDPDTYLPNLGLSLSTLYVRLGEVGRHEEALAAIEEAIAIQRNLAEANRDAVLPDLAASLNNLSNALGALDRHEGALVASQESVSIRRRLAETRPGAFLPDLAESLNNLSVFLREFDRDDEALAAIEETVTITRGLAEVNPDAHLADLAGNLNNLANVLEHLDHADEALEAAEEAVAIGRELVDADPDVFRPNLAMSLTNLALVLGGLGRTEEALAAGEEAVAVTRALADTRPQVFLPDLRQRLRNLARFLDAVGRDDDAVARLEEALVISRRLADADPDTFLPDLTDSLDAYSYALGGVGRVEEAVVALEESVAINRRLAVTDPDVFVPALADALDLIAAARNAFGLPDDAVAATESVAINRRLAYADPNRLADLARSLDNLYIALAMLGRDGEALPALEEAVAILRRLADADPDAFLPKLGSSLDALSMRLEAVDRDEEAVRASQESVVINRRLAEADPDGFLSDLADSLTTAAQVRSAVGNDAGALADSEEAVAIGRQLVGSDADEFGIQLAYRLRTLASCLVAVDREGDAVSALEEAVTIGRDRADSDDLAEWLGWLGLVLYQTDREQEALMPSEEAVAINRRLAETDPDGFLMRLADSLDTLSLVLYQLDRDREAVVASQEAVAIGRQIAADDGEYFPDFPRWLENLSNALDAVGRGAEARATLREATAIAEDLGDDG